MILSNIKSKKNRWRCSVKETFLKFSKAQKGKACPCVSFLVDLHAGDFYFIEYLWTAT